MPEGMVNGPEMGLPKNTVLDEGEDLSVLFKTKRLLYTAFQGEMKAKLRRRCTPC
jgi:hypothetical protein